MRRTRSCRGRAASRTTSPSYARHEVTRNAYQRLYDMVLSHGVEEYIDNKKKLVRYKFFRDEQHGGRDAVFGLDVPLMRLMNVLKSAAAGYGTSAASSCSTARSARRSRRSRASSRRAWRSTADRRWRAVHVLLAAAGRAQRARGRLGDVPVADARRAAAPDPRSGARRRSTSSSSATTITG